MLTIGLYGIRDTTHGTHPTYTHDHSVAVMRAGRVETVVPLERWTRRKYDNRLDRFLPEILADICPKNEPVRFVSVNNFIGAAFQTADGNLRIEPSAPVTIDARPVPARVRWYPDGLVLHPASAEALCHELAHVASLLPFVGRFEPESLLVHIDGGASDSACSFWWWDGERARLLESSWARLKTPVNNFNVGPLARAILNLAPHEHLSMPGKLMGYAGHGTPDPTLRAWLEEHRFFLDGPAESATLLALVNERFGTTWSAFDLSEPLCRDLCASMQQYFEDTVSAAILDWQARTGARHLYYAGGAALNIPTNARLEASGRFLSIHIPPCTSDTGLALGAAAWREYLDRGELERHGPFLCWTPLRSDTPLTEIDALAERLARGEILGVCNGAAEIGPRALGHRSILARPDRVELRRRVSEAIKRREWYRPVAPVLTAEVAEQAFGPEVARSTLAPYMLGAWPLRPGWESRFAGVVHADGTLRAQVLHPNDPDQAFLHALLTRLWRTHGIAGLINTSFNGPGEPIVHTPQQALASARQLGLDGVIIDGIYVSGAYHDGSLHRS
jgi:carbamoyltransferase